MRCEHVTIHKEELAESSIMYIFDIVPVCHKKKNTKIRIATVHEFKGKECDSVYVWNDSDGVFPSNKCELTDEEQVEEERRVHYIACTRAKKKEHIYCLNGKVGKFVKEMDLTIENPIKPSVNLNDKRSN